jgi:hypothetical protein
MKRVLFSLGAFAFASLSLASVNLNIDHEILTVSPGGTVTVYGTVTVTPGWDASRWAIEDPSNGSTRLDVEMDLGFELYVVSHTNANYSGPLFTVTARANQTPGLYDFGDFLKTGSDRSEFGVIATRLSDNAQAADYENYGIFVGTVPEPTSFAALGLGALALLRRRRRA